MKVINTGGEFPFYVASDGNCGPVYESLVIFDLDAVPAEDDDAFTELLDKEDYEGILAFLKEKKIEAILITY